MWSVANMQSLNLYKLVFLTVDKRGRNTLPEEVRRDLGVGDEESTLVILEKTDHGTYELIPASLVPKDQLWFHHPEVRRRIEQAEADFREGRSTSAANPEEAQVLLDRLKSD
jgi:bifunctional DNA-binding transcriptional regulator/antitoxin component of YhaV-PrlF toxin-antitoxin module